MASFRSLLRQPDFFRLWFGQIISSVGDRFYQFALLSLVLGLNEGTQVGKESARIIFVGMLPGFLLAPLLGWIVDRYDRRAVLIFSDMARVILVLGLIYLWFNVQNLGLVYLVVFAMGAMNCLFIPARQAVMPQLVKREELVSANALIALVGVIASLIGSILAGLLAALFGARLSFIVTALGFSVSAFFVARIQTPLHPPERVALDTWREHWTEIVSGWSYVKSSQITRWLIWLSAIFSFVSGFFVVSVLEYAVENLDLSLIQQAVRGLTDWLTPLAPKPPVFDLKVLALGGLLTGLGTGLGLGVLTCGRAKKLVHWSALPGLALMLAGLWMLLFAHAQSYVVAWGICVGLGWSGAILLIPVEARLQTEVPNETRGRVFALRNFATTMFFLTALALHLSGYLLHRLGAGNLILVLGGSVVSGAVTLSLLQRKNWREFWNEPPPS